MDAYELDRLAALVRSGLPPRAAVIEWGSGRADITGTVAARLTLGAPMRAACAVDGMPPGVALALEMADAEGGDLAATLGSLAQEERRVAAARAEAAAAVAGARLSARLITWLPVALVPFAPAWLRGAEIDASMVVCFLAGLLLARTGALWMGRIADSLVPASDPVVTACSVLAALCAGGTHPARALAAVAGATTGDVGRELRSAAARVRLGASWSGALGRCGPRLAALGAACDMSERTGVSLARQLRVLIEGWSAAAAAEAEARTRRAAVKMVLPLTLCALPAFTLLALVPVSRGLAGTG